MISLPIYLVYSQKNIYLVCKDQVCYVQCKSEKSIQVSSALHSILAKKYVSKARDARLEKSKSRGCKEYSPLLSFCGFDSLLLFTGTSCCLEELLFSLLCDELFCCCLSRSILRNFALLFWNHTCTIKQEEHTYIYIYCMASDVTDESRIKKKIHKWQMENTMSPWPLSCMNWIKSL